MLHTYSWPGNIRDLENAIQSAMIICKTGKLQPEHLPVRLNYLNKSDVKTETENETEREKIVKALEQCKHSKTDTANFLGISRKTLFNKMRKLGLE